MKLSLSSKRAMLALLIAVFGTATVAQAQVILSQIYGAGGNSGAVLRYDFVELYNAGTAAVDLSNYTIQYASTTGTTWSKAQLGGSIQPGKYFLIQACIGNTGSTNGAQLPTPDFTVPNTDTSATCVPAIAAAGGKLALVSNTTTLSGTGGTITGFSGATCPSVNTAAIVDFVGLSSSTCYKGAGPGPATSTTTSAIRNSSNANTNNNAADFSTAAPNPRNSAYTGGGGGTTPPVTNTAISTIQANRSTYVGNQIQFTGVITVVKYDGYYVQTPSTTPGSTGDEGIYVFSGANKNPNTAVVGNNVTVTGTLALYPLPTVSHTPSLEVTSATLTVNSTGQALPAPIVLPTGFPSATGDINQLRKYESMLVTVPSVTAVGGTDASLVETTETTTSTGQFYVVATGTPRPFREPGMDFRDYPSATCPTFANCPAATNPTTAAGQPRPTNVVLYDDNPERLIIESSLSGGNAIDVTAGAVLTNATGVVDYTFSTDYPYGDPARIILTAANRPTVTPSPLTVTALPLPSANQFTVAAFNVERFFDTNSANDIYYNPATGKTAGSQAVDVTADAYSRRLKKFSLAVRTVLNNPDIISVEEVENVQVLKDMAAQIDADTTTGAKPGYVAYGTDSTTTFTNDVGGISIGFLVKPSTVNVTKWEQTGTQTLVAAGTSALNDRPSQVLHATINRGAGITPYPITVISNHLRSLNAVNTATVQSKKELQAEMLATLIQGYQQAGEHVIAVGDMNAFQFSDGYTDTLGTITGNLSPAGTSVQPGKAIVSPAAVNLITTLPAAQQQSYTEWGNAQVLDHAIVTADIAATSTLAVGHIDADFPVVLYNDATTPAAMSDHDPLLAYLALPAAVLRGSLTGTATFPSTIQGVAATGQVFTLTNTGEGPIAISTVTASGDFAQSNNCGTSLAVGATCAINVVFTPTAVGARTGSLSVTANTSIAPVAFSGTGLPVPTFTLSDNNTGAATSSIILASGQTGAATLKFTSVNGFTANITVTCAAQGTAPAGASCQVNSPIALPANGTATATVLFITAPKIFGSGFGALPIGGRSTWIAVLALLGAAAYGMRRAGRNVRIGGLLALLFVAALGVTGCGSGNAHPSSGVTTPAGTYNYTVTATAAGVTRTQTIAVTVQ